jgi:hypothetical protein
MTGMMQNLPCWYDGRLHLSYINNIIAIFITVGTQIIDAQPTHLRHSLLENQYLENNPPCG